MLVAYLPVSLGVALCRPSVRLFAACRERQPAGEGGPAFGCPGVDAEQVSDDHGRQVHQGIHHGGVPCCAGGQTVVSQGVGETEGVTRAARAVTGQEVSTPGHVAVRGAVLELIVDDAGELRREDGSSRDADLRRQRGVVEAAQQLLLVLVLGLEVAWELGRRMDVGTRCGIRRPGTGGRTGGGARVGGPASDGTAVTRRDPATWRVSSTCSRGSPPGRTLDDPSWSPCRYQRLTRPRPGSGGGCPIRGPGRTHVVHDGDDPSRRSGSGSLDLHGGG